MAKFVVKHVSLPLHHSKVKKTHFLVVIFFPLTMRVVVVVLFMLALPGPASELLKVENEVKAFPLKAAWANASSKPCSPSPKGLNSDDVSEVPGWPLRPCLLW